MDFRYYSIIQILKKYINIAIIYKLFLIKFINTNI